MLFFIPRINSNKQTPFTLRRGKEDSRKSEKRKNFFGLAAIKQMLPYIVIFCQCITTLRCYMQSKMGGKTGSLIWHTILGNTLHFLSGICILQRHTTTHMIIEYPIFYKLPEMYMSQKVMFTSDSTAVLQSIMTQINFKVRLQTHFIIKVKVANINQSLQICTESLFSLEMIPIENGTYRF